MNVARVLDACYTLSACHLLRELAATGATQTARLGRLVDKTTCLLRNLEHATSTDPATGLEPVTGVPIPREKGLPPLVAAMIRSLYAVDLLPTSRHVEPPLADDTRVDTTEN